MLTRLFLFIIGYAKFYVNEADAIILTQLAFRSHIQLYIKRRNKYRRILCRECDYAALSEIAAGANLSFIRVRHSGIPVYYRRYKKRYGIYVGAVILILLLIFSDDFVWRIDIVGNENVSDEKILSSLSELGFCEGVYHRDIDFDVLHNRFLAKSEDIAWIAVNMHGNVATVLIREYAKPDKEAERTVANVVAAEDGVITQVSVFDGRAAVKIGDAVSEGQLLISGVMEYAGAETRYVYAKGEVYAEVERQICVSVPLTQQKKVITGEVKREYGIKIFSREIFFGRKGRIESDVCDTITMYKDLTLFGSVPLPLKLIVTEQTYSEYVTETVSTDSAAATAYVEYKHAFIDATSGVTLLSYQTKSGMNEDGDAYVIEATLRVIEDIAKTKEFDVDR